MPNAHFPRGVFKWRKRLVNEVDILSSPFRGLEGQQTHARFDHEQTLVKSANVKVVHSLVRGGRGREDKAGELKEHLVVADVIDPNNALAVFTHTQAVVPLFQNNFPRAASNDLGIFEPLRSRGTGGGEGGRGGGELRRHCWGEGTKQENGKRERAVCGEGGT